MKKVLLLFLFNCASCIVLPMFIGSAFSQGGMWIWMSGTNTTNAPGAYGTQGVPSVNNHPPGAYEYAQWKDLLGNFWVYGGTWPANADLWKYDPVTNEWTWVKGPGGSANMMLGPKGVFDPTYTPGSRGFGAGTWVDTTGNLWLFGGYTTMPVGEQADLWKYDISLNQWAWMGGNPNVASGGYHGSLGIPASNVLPGCRIECTATWTDSLNNLWLFGGYGYDDFGNYGSLNDLLKYNISTGEWTWMSGSQYTGAANSYGTFQVPDPLNCPGARFTCSNWKDSQGNFWFMGGSLDYQAVYNDVWKYDLQNNTWTWMEGTSTQYDMGHYTSTCVYDSSESPGSRYEHHASVTDNCGKFFLFGGTFGSPPTQKSYNDLWVFDPLQAKWNWLSGSNLTNQPGNYGTLGVASASNVPPARNGASAWWGNDNRYYLFGGMLSNTAVDAFSDLWVFIPDSNCISFCSLPPVAAYNSPDHLCPGTCTDFINLSLNATSYQWSFSGAVPSSSTDVNPTNICYPTPGSYDVQLIATNANQSDTLLLSNYITVFPSPPPQSITQSGDTLFAIAGAASYQWFYNGNIIPGATNYFYVASSSGDYNVVATDQNGCEVEAVINNVLAQTQLAVSSWQLAIFPNPVGEQLSVTDYLLSESPRDISIYNMLGEKILLDANLESMTVNCRPLKPGIYFLEVVLKDKSYRSKFVKADK